MNRARESSPACVRARVDLPGGRLIENLVLGPGDGIMLRRQLLGIRDRTGATVK